MNIPIEMEGTGDAVYLEARKPRPALAPPPLVLSGHAASLTPY